ncbi:MAG TPA: TlyA family RNA methyltransferase [Candidatus Saccharimonadales bacterium]|nr:TlyA family RNA methyltransferase [Candidatus Saccharimonadales bacterium]
MTAATARKTADRTRLDQLLVERGHAPSRERAQALILAGSVRVGGEVADRAALPVPAGAVVTVDPGPRFVSRGGEKLDGALADFGVAVTDLVVLDVGASTGGFTDRVLQGGARVVYAIDVGRGQLDWRLRNDPRVVSREGVNARTGFVLPERVDLIVADLSFISLRIALPPCFVHLREGGAVIALVKPQFEAGRAAVGRGGIVRDPAARADAVVAVAEHFTAAGVGCVAIAPSRIPGREGNREIFVHGRQGDAGLAPGRIREQAAEAAA